MCIHFRFCSSFPRCVWNTKQEPRHGYNRAFKITVTLSDSEQYEIQGKRCKRRLTSSHNRWCPYNSKLRWKLKPPVGLNLEPFLGYVWALTMRTIRYQGYKQHLLLQIEHFDKMKRKYISHTITKTVCVTFSCTNVSKAFGEWTYTVFVI